MVVIVVADRHYQHMENLLDHRRIHVGVERSTPGSHQGARSASFYVYNGFIPFRFDGSQVTGRAIKYLAP